MNLFVAKYVQNFDARAAYQASLGDLHWAGGAFSRTQLKADRWSVSDAMAELPRQKMECPTSSLRQHQQLRDIVQHLVKRTKGKKCV